MRGFGITHTGNVREENQDCFLLSLNEENEGSVFVVCDGMGGALAGGVASRVAAEAFITECKTGMEDEKLAPENIVSVAVRMANRIVFERSISDENCRGMGTTLVGGVYRDGRVVIANVGDSRAYLLKTDSIECITTDHSLVEQMVSDGLLTREQAREHPRKNFITRAIGIEPTVSCDIFAPFFGPSDRILICSDGLNNIVEDSEILDLSISCDTTDKLCSQLIGLSLLRGAPDNVTVAVIEMSEGC